MEFDINLILVPVMLILLVIWLVDMFFLRAHKAYAQSQKRIKQTQDELEKTKAAFVDTMQAHHISESIHTYHPNNAPEAVVKAYQNYHAARHENAKAQTSIVQKPAAPIGWAYEFLPVLVFLVVARAFIIEPFNIPSSSMAPTLYTGDYIIVNKFAYGLRLPITHQKVLNTGTPQHGDVVVFRYPNYEKSYYIKRVIGLPGDTVRYEYGKLFVNNTPINTTDSHYHMADDLVDTLLPKMIGTQVLSDAERAQYGRAEEQMAHYRTETHGSHTYNIRDLDVPVTGNITAQFLQAQSGELESSNGQVWQISVPDGQYFVMGDNRERSEDSRFWGFVDTKHLAGRASYIWMHKPEGFALPSFSRAGKID